jgi:hypothetical protein
MPAVGTVVWEGVEGVLGVDKMLGVAGVGIVVTGVVGFGGETLAGLAGGCIEVGGMRVTGVTIGGRIGLGIGLRFPDGGGIRVTGVANNLGGIGAGTGARGILFGTGGIGAD